MQLNEIRWISFLHSFDFINLRYIFQMQIHMYICTHLSSWLTSTLNNCVLLLFYDILHVCDWHKFFWPPSSLLAYVQPRCHKTYYKKNLKKIKKIVAIISGCIYVCTYISAFIEQGHFSLIDWYFFSWPFAVCHVRSHCKCIVLWASVFQNQNYLK